MVRPLDKRPRAEHIEGRRYVIRARYAAAVRRVLSSTFVKQSILVFGATMSQNALNYVFHFVASRLLSVAEYGAVSPLLALVSLLTVPSAIGTIVVAKYASEFHAVGDHAKLRRLWSTNVVGAMIAGSLAIGVMLLFRGSIASYLNLPRSDENAVVATAAFTLAMFIMPGIRGSFQGMQNYRVFGLLLLIESGVKFFASVAFIMMHLGVFGAIAGFAVGAWISDAVGLSLLLRDRSVASERLRLDIRRLVTTMLGVSGSTLVTTVLGFADLLLVKHYFDVYDAGVFAAISLVGKMLLFVIGFVPTVVLPRATALAKTGASPLPVLREAAFLMVLVAGGGLLVFALGGKYVIEATTGTKYLAATPFVVPYAYAMVFLGALTVVTAYKTGIHRFDFVIPIGIVAVLEIAAIARYHDSLTQVMQILVIGHALAFLVSLNGIWDGAPTRRATVERSAGGITARFVRRRA
jgi:O-antigen/teichoic acid export membrane protein